MSGLAATEAAFAEKVASTTSWKISFMSMLGNGVVDRTGGAWGAGILRASAAKAVSEEAKGKVFPMRKRESGLVGPDAKLCRSARVSSAGLISVGAQCVRSGRPGRTPPCRVGGRWGGSGASSPLKRKLGSGCCFI